ncbi:MAG TPA: histidine kinase dimerization/phospho-acceptor domain-containing protein, partial [Myxococcota bacterium]|nr:histidine kinase dimerization/phospho-acceptor domain-containing protein [Myxococcota bacterium]
MLTHIFLSLFWFRVPALPGPSNDAYARIVTYGTALALAASAPAWWILGLPETAAVALAMGILSLTADPLARGGYERLSRAAPLFAATGLMAWVSLRHGADSMAPLATIVLLMFPPLLSNGRDPRWTLTLQVLVTAVGVALMYEPDTALAGPQLTHRWPDLPRHVTFGVILGCAYHLALLARRYAAHDERLTYELRTRRLAERAAEQARGHAATVEQASANFVTTLSRELRTPLTGVVGLADLLEATPLNERQHDMLRLIRSSSDHLRYVIDDLLDLSEIDTKGVEFAHQPFFVGALVEEVVEKAAAAHDDQLAILPVIDMVGDIEVEGDITRMRQVLNNLIQHAVGLTQRGWIEVRLTARLSGATANLQIDVQDTGCGVPHRNRTKLFAELERQTGESGFDRDAVSLSLSRRLVQRMGGALTTRGKLEEGPTFSVSIRLPASGRTRRQEELPGTRIAILSSLQRRADTLRSALTQMQASVSTSSSLSAFAGRQWDLVLVDIPGEAARREVCELLRVSERRVLTLTRRRSNGPALPWPADRASVHKLLTQAIESGPRTDDPGEDARFRGVHALVAEDNPVNQMILRTFLDHFGVTCDIVADGRAACSSFDAGRHRIVFMDVRMPGLSGTEATTWIRDHVDQDGTIPII